MHYFIDRKENYSVASITELELEIVAAVISIDFHELNSQAAQAVSLMYSDALLSGAGTYSREAFLDAVNTLGATVSVTTGGGVLNVSVRSTAQVFPKVIKLVQILLLEPTFPTVELKRIRDTVINGLHEHKENSKAIALESLRNEFYGTGDRKYAYDIDATIKAVEQTDMVAIKAQHEIVLHKNWVCTITGNEKIVKTFTQMLAQCKKGIELSLAPAVHEQKVIKNKVLLTNIPSKQNIDFSIGAPIPFTLHHPDYIPLSFALAVLGKWGGFAGRLMSTVREKEGLTYGIYSGLEGFTGAEQGYWRIMTFFSPEKALQGLTSTFREITKLYKHGITEDEFSKFKVVLSTGQVLLNDSVMSLMNDLHAYHVHGFTLVEMKEHKNKINSITIKEVNEVIKKYLNPKTLVISGAGPVQAVKKDIQKFVKGV